MHYYKTTIQYEGTNYAGFQWQNGLPTVQDEINKALIKIIDGKITTMAASRTDTGVHAIDQTVKITSSSAIESLNFLKLMNDSLPQDIKCASIETCDGKFRPASEALSKEYRYFFTNKKRPSPLERKYVANIANTLNIEAMKICARELIGTHDFCNFYSSGSNVKSTIRKVSVCELSEIDPHEVFSGFELFNIPAELKHCYEFKIEANGFLKQMIRHIVSALWKVGSGKLSSEEFRTLLNGTKAEKQLWKVAEPNGLYLFKINY